MDKLDKIIESDQENTSILIKMKKGHYTYTDMLHYKEIQILPINLTVQSKMNNFKERTKTKWEMQ